MFGRTRRPVAVPASLALHDRAGFRVIGLGERVGRHHGRWRDVVLLERRSPVIT